MNYKTFTQKYLADAKLKPYQEAQINEIYEFINSKGNNESWQIWVLKFILTGIKIRVGENKRALDVAILTSMKSKLKRLQHEYSLVLYKQKEGDLKFLRSEIEKLRTQITMIEDSIK